MTSYLDTSRDCRAVVHTAVFGPRYCDAIAVTKVRDAAGKWRPVCAEHAPVVVGGAA